MKTRKTHILLALTLGLATALALIWSAGQARPARALAVHPGTPRATNRYVRTNGADFGDCSFAAAPCRTVQYAVDVAGTGDLILVAGGTYQGVQAREGYTQVVYLTKTVAIRGGFAPNFGGWDPQAHPTTLDAQRQGRVFYIVGGGSPVIEWLRLTNGDAARGGGSQGGGISAIGGSGPSLTVTLRHSTIVSNFAPSTGLGGGGLSFIFCNVVLEDNTIAHNESAGAGGGVRMEQSNGHWRNNVFRFNRTAASGGAIYLTFANVQMTNTVIADNETTYAGPGLVASGAWPGMWHTTLARNTGGEGSGIYATGGFFPGPSSVRMTNTIIVSQTVGVTVTVGAPFLTNTVRLSGVLWYANGQNTGGGGNIYLTDEATGDPGFRADGYHIGPGSAAIDWGLATSTADDIDGDSRPIGSGPDLGADEAWLFATLPLVRRD